MRKIFITALLLLAVLSGCGKQEKPQSIRFITGITVTSIRDGHLERRQLTKSAPMQRIMNYLRQLDPYNKTGISADTFRTDAYEIIVSYSDGNHATYRQIYDQYLQLPNGSWRCIDPKLGNKLPEILDALSSQEQSKGAAAKLTFAAAPIL